MANIKPLPKELPEDDIITCIDDGTGIEKEEIEGDGKITEPFDPTLIRVNHKVMVIDLLVSRIKEKELDLMPDFQRKAGIWSDAVQSRLIESILIRIPLPAFYMDGTDENNWLVVDGLQRLTTIDRFVIKNELELTGLEFLNQIEGKTFKELPRNLQRRIKETQVTVYLIERGTPADVKFNIFKRINTGGLPLSPQEIRHALNQGDATKMLDRLSKSIEFKRATDNGIHDKRMADQECVLRFIAFTITPYYKYKTKDFKDFDTFLNYNMGVLNKMSNQKREDLEKQFLRSMVAAFGLFGKYAFRKLYKEGRDRNPINKALFEAWSVNLNQLTDEQLKILQQKKDTLKQKFIDLMNNDRDFEDAISQGTGDIKKVDYRFRRIEKLLQEVLS